MRSLYFIILLAFTSCTFKHHILLPNHSIIEANDYTSRSFKIGDTVCVKQLNLTYEIDSNGNMKDTSYIYSSSSSKNYYIKYQIGVIIK